MAVDAPYQRIKGSMIIFGSLMYEGFDGACIASGSFVQRVSIPLRTGLTPQIACMRITYQTLGEEFSLVLRRC